MLLDDDPELLAEAEPCGAVRTMVQVTGDLDEDGLDAIDDAHLVTGSALLDLVSEQWLRRLVDACARRACGTCFALTYDGEIRWSNESTVSHDDGQIEGPGESTVSDHDGEIRWGGRLVRDREGDADSVEPPVTQDLDDAFVRKAVNSHQRGDKGLGFALGPTAGARAEELFREVGFRTWAFASPWRLGPSDAAIVEALIGGWEHAAVEQRPEQEKRIRDWAIRRRATVAQGDFALTVGHIDLLALPPESAA